MVAPSSKLRVLADPATVQTISTNLVTDNASTVVSFGSKSAVPVIGPVQTSATNNKRAVTQGLVAAGSKSARVFTPEQAVVKTPSNTPGAAVTNTGKPANKTP